MLFTSFLDKDAAGASRIPTREECNPGDTWDLSLLYPNEAVWEAELATVEADYPTYRTFRGQFTGSAAAFRDCLEFDRSLDLRIEKLYHYASLRVSENSSDDAHLVREGRLSNLLTLIGETASFFVPEIQAIEDDRFAALLADPALAEWRTKLERIRRFRAHTLSEPEERLLALGGAALQGHSETFSQLTDVDMQFGVITDDKGREVALSQSSFSSFLVKRDPAVRRTAFHQFYQEFSAHKFTLASTLAYSVKADVFRARARNQPSALEAALFPDRIPVEVYNNLISAVRANLDPLHCYYDLRKRLFKLDEIHHYDTYVPIVEEIENDTPWERAVEMVCDALQPLGDEYVATLREGLDGRWCDRYETKGKRSGAFSSSSYGNPPYILMNYKRDVFSDVYTLAHEAGHSMHSWYSQRHQTFQDYGYPIFSAEVASTFNEELLTHHLLQVTTDRKMRTYLINRQIDDIRGTLYRQTMFAEFERVIHALEEEGEALTLEVFRTEYRKLLEVYFGERFTLDEDLSLECLRIPHFYNAFYVYKYATGISAAVALSRKVLAGGPSDVQAYLGFLKSGGSEFPLETLRTAGVDMAGPKPISATLQLFAERVEEFEGLL